jgi:hypothetical protein
LFKRGFGKFRLKRANRKIAGEGGKLQPQITGDYLKSCSYCSPCYLKHQDGISGIIKKKKSDSSTAFLQVRAPEAFEHYD